MQVRRMATRQQKRAELLYRIKNGLALLGIIAVLLMLTFLV